MALIVCPECGGSISNKADHCVHCGCRIIICPECDTTYIEEVPVCTECGYTFQKKPKPEVKEEKKANTEIKTLADADEAWSKRNSSSGTWGCILTVVVGLLFVVPVALLILWKVLPADVFSKIWDLFPLLSFSSYFLTTAVIEGCFGLLANIAFIATIVSCFINTANRRAKKYNLWASGQNFDLKELLIKEITTKKENLSYDQCDDRVTSIHNAIYRLMLTDPQERSKARWQSFWSFIAVSISIACITAFVTINVPIYMLAEMNGDYALSMVVAWWLLAVGIGVFVLGAILEPSENKECKAWLQKEMPDVMEDYNSILEERKRLKKLYKKYGKKDETDEGL